MLDTQISKTGAPSRGLKIEPKRNGKTNLRLLSLHPPREKKTPPLDKFIDKTVDQLSKPIAIYAQTALTAIYMAANIVTFGRMTHFDPYPFLFLNFIYSLASGYATVFVLNSNRRQDFEARQRQDAILKAMHKILEDNHAQSRIIKHFIEKEGLSDDTRK
jgi:uncharacterized membrane protein